MSLKEDAKITCVFFFSSFSATSVTYQAPTSSTYHLPSGLAAPGTGPGPGPISRPDTAFATSPAYHSRHSSNGYVTNSGSFGVAPYKTNGQGQTQAWDFQGRYSPSDSMDDIIGSPSLSDHSLEAAGAAPAAKSKSHGKGRPQRRPSNRDEFDGPHQFLQRPPVEYVAIQERELPHLPTNLLVQEQDSILTQVNDRLSQCAFDFVAKYQFPIPLTQDMRPVERPQDREWTEWVYLLKRLATKRRIPARVLYNGQIKQFVTILENSLEMRHAAKHQSRPLKDDRNILQLISAGIQVAKILKDATAMDYLDKLYVSTEKQIQERSAAAAARFR
ncbi:uncharacterized protein MKZ38_008075 [Zalerion maritima]|uniref:Uncharacterized protein n=1 Tax=Zalerion maritima TaxID=339359 RepID=A0AAD5WMY1_9PEZI|nr:uncharacterized protein MKZ38_008075 [Zalerion maritima]